MVCAGSDVDSWCDSLWGMAERGRRAGRPDTRSEVLDAAREEFGASGFAGATIRSIANRAGVDPALVHHYFGTKADLFAASIALPFSPVEAIGEALQGDRNRAAWRLAQLFFDAWEGDAPRAALLGLLRASIGGNEQATNSLREFVVLGLRDHLAALIDEDDSEMRASAIAGHLVGCAIVRYVLVVEPFASAEVDEIVDLVAPQLQAYLN